MMSNNGNSNRNRNRNQKLASIVRVPSTIQLAKTGATLVANIGNTTTRKHDCYSLLYVDVVEIVGVVLGLFNVVVYYIYYIIKQKFITNKHNTYTEKSQV